MQNIIEYILLIFFGTYYIVFFITLIYYMVEEEWFCKNYLPELRENIKEKITNAYLYIKTWRERKKYQKIDEYVPEINFKIEKLDDII